MRRTRSIVAVLAMTAIGVSGCARPTVAKDPGPGHAVAPDSPFCKQFLAYRTATLGLSSLLASDPTKAAEGANAAAQQLLAMKSTATDNSAIQGDLQTVADGFTGVANRMVSVPANNRTAYLAAVNAGIASVGTAKVSSASSSLDSYTTTQCGLTAAPNLATSTTVAGVTTTAPPAGPALPSSTTR